MMQKFNVNILNDDAVQFSKCCFWKLVVFKSLNACVLWIQNYRISKVAKILKSES